MSFGQKFASYIRKGFQKLKTPRFEFPRRNSTLPLITFVGYTLVASSHAWTTYETLLKTGEGKKAFQNPTRMLELATLDEHTVDVSGILLAKDAIPAVCEIVHSGIASMESRLKAVILLTETCQYNKTIRRHLIDSGELQRILDTLDSPCNLVAVKVMLLKHLSVEEDAFQMIWNSPKFMEEIFPCIIPSNLNNIRFRQLTRAQQLTLVRLQLADVRDVFKNHLQSNSTGRQQQTRSNTKPTEVEIPNVFMDEVLPFYLTEMALDASKRPGMCKLMAQNNFVDVLNSFIINTDPWYNKLLNIDGIADSLINAKRVLKNISMECYKERGWPEDEPLPPTQALTPTPTTLTQFASSAKTPAQIVSDLKDANLMRRSWVLIFSDKNSNMQIVVDGKDEVVKKMIPYVKKMGLRVVPSLEVLELDYLARAEKLNEVPLVDWQVMQNHLPSVWLRGLHSPALPSLLDVVREVGPAVLGLSYGTARAYLGMRQAYRGSHAMQTMGRMWCLKVALRTGARTGLAVVVMGMLPSICRWITGNTQKYFETPKGVVACSIAEGVAIVGTGAYLIRNCHYWFLPFVTCYIEPKQVIEELVVKLRD